MPPIRTQLAKVETRGEEHSTPSSKTYQVAERLSQNATSLLGPDCH